jgi:hypothetical protein
MYVYIVCMHGCVIECRSMHNKALTHSLTNTHTHTHKLTNNTFSNELNRVQVVKKRVRDSRADA